MRDLAHRWCVQIDITSVCGIGCIYCTRYDRHLGPSQRIHMTQETFRRALDSVHSFAGKIGIIGGEPTFHPEFLAFCEIIRQSGIPKDQFGLWTVGNTSKKYKEYQPVIAETFGFMAYNEHNDTQKSVCKHQPLTIAIRDAVPDEVLRARLIDDCWVAREWCGTIAPWGKAFFCEVAYGQALLRKMLDYGYPLWREDGRPWWTRRAHEYQDQVREFCDNCGMAIPQQRQTLDVHKEIVSPTVLRMLRESGLPKSGAEWVHEFHRTFTAKQLAENAETWKPGNYRDDKYGSDAAAPEPWGSTVLKS